MALGGAPLVIELDEVSAVMKEPVDLGALGSGEVGDVRRRQLGVRVEERGRGTKRIGLADGGCVHR